MTTFLRLIAIAVWLVAVATLLAFFGVIPLEGTGLVLPLVAVPGYASVGLILILHRPTGTVGWLMLGMGGLPAIGAVTGVGSAELANGAVLIGLALMLVFFPDGRLPSRKWSVPIAMLVGGWSLAIFAPGFLWRRDEGFALHPGVISGLLGVLACTTVPFVRRRRAGLVERAQLRWLGAAATATGLMAALALGPAVSSFVPDGLGELASGLGLLFGVFGIPAAVLIAVVRYRLYEIDRIISRTITYLALGTVVLAIYSLPVLVLPSVLGGSSDLVVALSTLAAAAAFNPARRRIQRAVDRRFHRAHYDAESEIEAFSARLRSNLTLDSIDAALTNTMARTVQPTTTGLWIKERS
jgi:hypothetical protein